MNLRNLLYNSITISLPKNAVQFFLGTVLFWLIMGIPNPVATVAALTGFLLTYSSVYLLNDIVDHKEDMKNREKLKWKLVAGKMIGIRKALILSMILLFSGLSVSLYVSRWFFIIMLLLIFLNSLHSSPWTRFKRSLPKTSVNMTAIQFLKFSTGWFALTSNISEFPFWLILGFSIVYTTSYVIYKFGFRGKTIKSRRGFFWTLGIIGGASYFISFIVYGLPLSLIFLVLIPTIILLFFKRIKWKCHKITNMIILEYLLLPIIIVSFLVVLLNPALAKVNYQIAKDIENYTEDISDALPQTVTEPIKNISDELKKYQNLEDIEETLNSTIRETIT
jgi:4-hydroxybenzoate polyprenyltransferase